MNEQLERLIHERCGSYAALARRMGWTRKRVWKLLHSQASPKLKTVNALARAAGVSVQEIIRCYYPEG